MYKIKCRAWDTSSNSWVNGWGREEGKRKIAPSWDHYIHIDGKKLIIDCSGGTRVIVVQYTEINDKNGVESCQKDICEDKRGRFVIEKQEDGWVRRYLGVDAWGERYTALWAGGGYPNEPFTIIGNTFENPELTKES